MPDEKRKQLHSQYPDSLSSINLKTLSLR